MKAQQNLAALHDELDSHLAAGNLDAALAVSEQLEQADPDEPRWAHRRGDLLLRLGRAMDAVGAYERAVDLYVGQGFTARGAALAKVILGLAPSRRDVLERVDGRAIRAARDAKREITSSGLEAVKRESSVPAAPSSTDPLVAEVLESARRSFVLAAPLLEPDESAPHDEVRFVDAQNAESSLELDSGRITSDFVAHSGERPDLDVLVDMPSVPLFADVPKEALTQMLELSDLVELESGELLVRKGDSADSLFILAEGGAEVRLESGLNVPLSEGEIVGETCLFAEMTRKADVAALGHLLALRLDRPALELLVHRWPVLGGILYDLLTTRLVQNLLSNSELFTAFDPATRNELGRMFEARKVPPETTIIAEGKRADGMYVPLLGELEAAFADGRSYAVPHGSLIGEQSLISRLPMTSTVRTRSDAIVLRLPTAKFTELAAVYPSVLEHLAELASRGTFEERLLARPTSV